MEQELPNIMTPDILSVMRPERICTCMHLTRSDLLKAIENGHNTFNTLQEETGCSTGCGCCETQVRQILKDLK